MIPVTNNPLHADFTKVPDGADDQVNREPLSPREIRREYLRNWRTLNREHLREYLRRWKAEHPDRVIIHRLNEYARRRKKRRDLRRRREAQRRRRAMERLAVLPLRITSQTHVRRGRLATQWKKAS